MNRKLRDFGRYAIFTGEVLSTLKNGVSGRLVLDQMYCIGVRSVGVTVLTGLFVGGIMVIQINLELRDFGAQGFLGGLTTSTTIRDVGPVLIGFLLAGKVGAFTSAELGTMSVTQQIQAMRCLGVNPLSYLVLPRLIAVTLSSFMLLVLGLMTTIVGGALVADIQLGVNALNYMERISTVVEPWSVVTGLIKSLIFGFTIGSIACYQGYFSEHGAAGVGKTVQRSAVSISLMIIVLDYLLGQLSIGFQSWLAS